MAHVVSGSCINCGSYTGECPVNTTFEGNGEYIIDVDTCIDCGTCAATCPTGAIED